MAKDAQGAANSIEVPEGTPEVKVVMDDLASELRDAVATNSIALEIKTQSEQLYKDIKGEALESETCRSEAKAIMDRARARARKEIEKAEKHDRAGQGHKTALDQMPEPPAPVETQEIHDRIADAEATNAKVDLLIRRKEHEDRAEGHRKRSRAYTANIDEIKAEIKAAIEAADMPVEGLGLGQGVVTFDGLPFDQASDAQRLQVSCSIAMRDNAELRVIRIRDGSLLDEDSMAGLRTMAVEADYQVWVERVDTTGKVGIVIEDGSLLEAEEEEVEEESDGDND